MMTGGTPYFRKPVSGVFNCVINQSTTYLGMVNIPRNKHGDDWGMVHVVDPQFVVPVFGEILHDRPAGFFHLEWLPPPELSSLRRSKKDLHYPLTMSAFTRFTMIIAV